MALCMGYPGETVSQKIFTHACGGAHGVIHAIFGVLWCKGKTTEAEYSNKLAYMYKIYCRYIQMHLL